MEVRNRFKGLDLIDRVPEELWTEAPSEIVSFVHLFNVCLPLNVSFMREDSHLSNPPLNAQHLAKYLAANRCPI